jgi:hypothetical protein
MQRSLSVAALVLALGVTGCATTETAKFQPAIGQQALIRDGQAAIVSKKPGSVIIIRPAARDFQSGSRPAFVVGIYNPTGQPQNFFLTNISVTQVKNGAPPKRLKVYSYEELAKEERNRQIAARGLAGASGA